MAANPHHEGSSTLVYDVCDGANKWKEIAPNDLSIVWGEDARYWSVTRGSPAELYQVCWLEVRGCVDGIRPDKEYEVGFNISLMPDAFGWGGSPVYILVKRGKGGKFTGKKFFLDKIEDKDQQDIKVVLAKSSGETGQDSDNSKLHFGLYEVWSGKWKGGLKINYVFVRELP